MSRRRLPVAGLGGMFSLAARVPIFSGYYTTPAVEGKGRADCASAARGPSSGSREERSYPGISPLPFFSGTPLGRRRFPLAFVAVDRRRAFSLCAAGRAAAYRPYGRVRALPQLFSFWADAQQGKGRGFLERKPPKELLRSLRSASLQLQLLPGVFPRFRQGAQGGQVLLIPVGVLQHALFVEAGAHQPLALL